jgi:hypothetical protein
LQQLIGKLSGFLVCWSNSACQRCCVKAAPPLHPPPYSLSVPLCINGAPLEAQGAAAGKAVPCLTQLPCRRWAPTMCIAAHGLCGAVLCRDTILRHEALLCRLALLGEKAAMAGQLASRAWQQARRDPHRSETCTQGMCRTVTHRGGWDVWGMDQISAIDGPSVMAASAACEDGCDSNKLHSSFSMRGNHP